MEFRSPKTFKSHTTTITTRQDCPAATADVPSDKDSALTWVAGYWYPVANHYKWHAGYWTRPPYASARWISPHHDGQMFYNGYWEGDKGRIDHDHKWDRDKKRRDSRS